MDVIAKDDSIPKDDSIAKDDSIPKDVSIPKDDTPIPIKKKRGRKSKQELALLNEQKNEEMSKCVINEDPENTEKGDNTVSVLSEIVKSPAKKRGRKPKGGKIVEPVIFQMNKEVKSNVMLHLKCRIADLYNNPLEDTNIQGYNLIDQNEPQPIFKDTI